MVEQVKLDLTTPLLGDADTTISTIPLEPALATAALTLHGDFYRQLQSKANRRIFWHPVTQTISIIVLVLYFVYSYYELIEISDSIGEFWVLCWNNKYLLTTFFPVLTFLAGSIGLISFIISDEFRNVSDSLKTDAVMLKIFRFPLRIYANHDSAKDKDLGFIESASQSTEFIKYRDSPIAVVTVVPLPDKSSSEIFYAKITGLHVRKVYAETGLQNELLEIAKSKAKKLCSRYMTDMNMRSRAMKVVLIAEAYSLDPIMSRILEEHNFKIVETSSQVNPFTDRRSEKVFKLIPINALMKALGMTRLVYECQLEGEIEPLEKRKEPKTLRKRKN